jgi:hypothetical protein
MNTPNPALTDDEIEAFILGKLWVLRKGTETTRQAARIIRRLYDDRRKLRDEVGALKAAMGMDETKHTERVTRSKRA